MRTLKYIADKLSPKEQEELELITERIKNAGSVDMIILYGSYACGEQVRNCDGKMSDYDILVITSSKNEKSLKRIRYLLGALFQDIERNVSCEVECLRKWQRGSRKTTISMPMIGVMGLYSTKKEIQNYPNLKH